MESSSQIQGQQEYTKEQKEMAYEYQKLENERRTLIQKIIEIGEEKREYTLVLETVSALDGDRKCWRLVNGVLVEKSLGGGDSDNSSGKSTNLVSELKSDIDNMDNLIKQLEARSIEIRQVMAKIEDEIGQTIKESKGDHKGDHEVDTKGAGGVLV